MAQAQDFQTKSGQTRQFELFDPQTNDNEPLPVIFVLHGGRGSARSIHHWFNFDLWATRQPSLVVYPQGINKQWNDGRAVAAKKFFHGDPPDDVAFLSELAADLVDQGKADPQRIFVIGVSNGGMMTQRLLCEASETFGAGVSLVANLPAALHECNPAHPRPLLMINGDADPLMPWNGGGVGFWQRRGKVLSSMDSFARWQDINRCKAKPRQIPIPDRNQTDNSTALLLRAQNCQTGNEIALVWVKGGGHTVPGLYPKKSGRRARRIQKLLGPTNLDLNAKAMIWTFLQTGELLDSPAIR